MLFNRKTNRAVVTYFCFQKANICIASFAEMG